MKKVINGLIYDTDKAVCIGSYSNNLSNNDFRHVDESLYMTANGRFFLQGEGGPMTKYAESVGSNSFCGSCKIIPIDEKQAREWCEMSDIDADVISNNFKTEEA